MDLKVKHNLTDDQLKLAELQVCKGKCFLDTLFFTRYHFKGIYGRSFVVGEHHDIISKALDRVFRGECKRLIINVAPRYGKTELAVKNFIAKGLGVNPKAKFIHLSYSDSLALDNSEGVKDIIKSDRYKELYPEVQIKKGTDSKQKWYTTEGGGVYAAAAGGQVTGFGAGIVDEENENSEELEEIPDDFFIETISGFGGAIIIDDPIKPEDAEHETIRTKVNSRFDTTIVNRVNSRNTPIIIIMQRLHENDLTGHILENYEGYEVVSLPAIKADGTALWPFKHTREELDAQRKANEFVFDTQMMQDPTLKQGKLFPKTELQYFRPDPARKFESSTGYVDVADEGPDYTSAPIGRNIGPYIYITAVVFTKANSEIAIPRINYVATKEECGHIRVEANSMGAMFSRNLAKEFRRGKVWQAISTGNKHSRIMNDSGFIKQWCKFLEPEFWDDDYKAFMTNLYAYLKEGKVKNDDAPDSLSGLVMFIRSIYGKHYR